MKKLLAITLLIGRVCVLCPLLLLVNHIGQLIIRIPFYGLCLQQNTLILNECPTDLK